MFEFSLRIDSLSSSLLDNRDNKARLIGSYNRTDRCSLSRFIHLRSRHESFHRVTEKFERISFARKIKTIENERNCFLWILAIPTENLAEFQTRYAAMAYL